MRPRTAARMNPLMIPHPVAAVQEEERCGGPDVEKSEHRDERRAGFVEVEPIRRGTTTAWPARTPEKAR